MAGDTGSIHLGAAGAVAASADEWTYLEAVNRALADAMAEDERVFLLGEDIGHFGGPFGATKGLFERFGPERVIDTPIAEEGFVGAAIGAAWMGERPVAELQFADFVSCPFDAIVTVAAKTHWRSGIRVPIVVRAPSGGGVGGGPFHSQSPEGWFVGEPGLKVVCPGTVEDAYGLLRSAIDDDDPVLFFEHKALYRSLKGAPPPAGHRVPLGRARVAQAGGAATMVTYAAGVRLALEAAAGLDVEVVDLRTVWPFDREAVLASVAKTGRLLVLQEASAGKGAGDAVIALVAAEAFADLDAPPRLVAPPVAPVPFSPALEEAYLPDAARVRRELEDLLAF